MRDMKFGFVGLLTLFGMAFAHIFPGPSGPSITDCAKWSGMTFCKDWYGPPAHVTSEASRCKANLNADGYVIYHQYRRDPNHPPVPFYKIYVRTCFAWVYGTNAPSQNVRTTMLQQMTEIFPQGGMASNSHFNADGHIKLYMIDSETDAIYETTFDDAGTLLNIEEIDPAVNEYFLAVLETSGLEFGSLASE